MRAAFILALVAACGGGKASPPPTPPSPPPEAAAKPTLTHDQHVAALEDIATRGCACADAACVRAVDAELAQLIRELPVPSEPMSDDQALNGLEALGRYLGCLNKLGVEPELSYHDAFVARLADIADAICACRDARCTERVAPALMPELLLLEDVVVRNESLASKVEPHYQRMDGCAAPIHGAVTEQAVSEMAALRDAACACTTAGCAAAVNGDFEAFLARHATTTGSQDQAERIGALADEMRGCLEVAGGQTGPKAP